MWRGAAGADIHSIASLYGCACLSVGHAACWIPTCRFGPDRRFRTRGARRYTARGVCHARGWRFFGSDAQSWPGVRRAVRVATDRRLERDAHPVSGEIGSAVTPNAAGSGSLPVIAPAAWSRGSFRGHRFGHAHRDRLGLDGDLQPLGPASGSAVQFVGHRRFQPHVDSSGRGGGEERRAVHVAGERSAGQRVQSVSFSA